MASPDFDLPDRPLITEIDLAQRAVKDTLGRATDPDVIRKILPLLQHPLLGSVLTKITLARLLNEEKEHSSGEILLSEQPVETFREALVNRWQIYFTLPETEQQALRESAQKEFLGLNTRG